MGNPSASAVQLAIADDQPAGRHRGCSGLPGRLRLDKVVDNVGRSDGGGGGGGIPLDELEAFFVREDGDPRCGHGGIGCHGRDHAQPLLNHPCRARGLEQVAVVDQPAGDVALWALIELQLEIESCAAHGIADLALHQMHGPRWVRPHGRRLQDDYRLIDRVGVRDAVGVELPDQPLEWHEVVEAVEQLVADSHDKVGEGGVAAQVDSQDQGRQGVADDRFQLWSLAKVRSRGEDHIVLSRVPAEQQGPDGRKHLEERGSNALADLTEAQNGLFGHGKWDHATAKTLRWWPSVVEGKGEDREWGEVMAPMLQSPCDPRFGDPVLFPAGVVGVMGPGLGKW